MASQGMPTSGVTFRRLSELPDPKVLAPDVVALIHEAGNPFFDWFFGGPEPARAALEGMLLRSSSEVAASRVTALLEEGSLRRPSPSTVPWDSASNRTGRRAR